MQPYQEASKEIQRQGKLPLTALKTAASIGASALGGVALGRVLPFLSEFIPQDIAIKGLSKIDPRFGKFINTALNNGKSFDEVKEFIQEKAENWEKNQQASPNKGNIISQYDDKLHAFIDNLIKQGRSPLEAGALARSKGDFNKSIAKMEKDHKTNFSSIIEAVYGKEQPQQASAAQSQQSQTSQVSPAQIQKNQPQQPSPAQSQQNQAPQGLDPQLAQLMQGIRSSIQNIRGR